MPTIQFVSTETSVITWDLLRNSSNALNKSEKEQVYKEQYLEIQAIPKSRNIEVICSGIQTPGLSMDSNKSLPQSNLVWNSVCKVSSSIIFQSGKHSMSLSSQNLSFKRRNITEATVKEILWLVSAKISFYPYILLLLFFWKNSSTSRWFSPSRYYSPGMLESCKIVAGVYKHSHTLLNHPWTVFPDK